MACAFLLLFPATSAAMEQVKTGAAVLAERGFADLKGLRVGLVVNHTARVGDRHLISLVHEAENVTLGAIFGPEHGLRGTEEDGVVVHDGRDSTTGAPVYSLYGQHRKPTPAMLEGLDVLVYDIQDVGARFYTFISTMGLAMQAAAEAGLSFMVLDRPNPLSGAYVSGFVLEPAHVSFVGQYAIPIAHGLTSGELARMLVGKALLPGLEGLTLEVVSMEGYRRAMQWPDTGLPWINTSPNIPGFETALVYAGTCFFEATAASEGRGTRTPFTLIGAPWAEGAGLASALNGADLPGVQFAAAAFVPVPTPGMDMNPKLEGRKLEGITITITERRFFQPVEAGVHILHAFYQAAPDKEAFLARPNWLEKLSGTSRLEAMLTRGTSPDEIVQSWQAEVAVFGRARLPYLLYH